jgi:putative methanogenesis marker protein 17
MKALEYFEVECPEELGGRQYKEIAAAVLQDLDLIKNIGRLHIAIYPDVPCFIAVGVTRKLPRLVRVHDLANVMEREGEGEIVLDIADETHLASLLSQLWDRFGRDSVEQPDRFTVIIRSPGADPRAVEELVVFDPSEGMYKDIIYAMQYIAPEGFKVRRQRIEEGRFYYVASEDTLPEDVVERVVAAKFALVGVTL